MHVNNSFFGRYQRLVKDTVIPFQEAMLRDLIPGAAKTHAVENFRLAAAFQKTGEISGTFCGMVFQDSDLAKWLEAAAYSLTLFPDPALEASCDEIIILIKDAQYPDGYVNTYFTLEAPDKKWTNLAEAHELYCAGHMIEAGIAYYEATGKSVLLDTMCKMADHIYTLFITQKKPGYPGHPEIELALLRLFNTTGNPHYKALAKHFIDVRGVDSDYFINEARHRDWYVWSKEVAQKTYAQNHAPVREQDKAVGHAVRAVYLYTAMAHQAALSKDESLAEACRRLWGNITDARMYVTGGIGSAYEGEAFTEDYHLPNDTAYAETCAAIGLVFFARKMLAMEKKSQYADVMERALYNGILSGMQLEGKKFFYVNPLEAIPGLSGKAATHHHVLPQRPEWFGCACCPPNLARILMSLAEYAWIEADETLYSNLFVGGSLALAQGGTLEVATNYPHDGQVKYTFHTKIPITLTLAIRMPDWSKKTHLLYNGSPAVYEMTDGYAYIKNTFNTGDNITLELDMRPVKIYANSRVSADHGKVAFMRGPLVYCAEGVDNDHDVQSLIINQASDLIACPYEPETLGGIVPLEVGGFKVEQIKTLYTYEKPALTPTQIRLIPYYAWSNRGLTQMRVWMPER